MNSFQWLLYLMPPILALFYAVTEYCGGFDYVTGRGKALEGLDRLRSTSGYPKSWIYDDDDDREHFDALYQRIKKKTKDPHIRKAIGGGHRPSLITPAGEPIKILKIDPNWSKDLCEYYADSHPVMFVFGVVRGSGTQNGKCGRVCSLKDIDSWLKDEKEKRRLIVGGVLVSIISVLLVSARLSLV